MVHSIHRVTSESREKDRECIWVKAGVISYRTCTRDFRCFKCELDQSMIDHDFMPVADESSFFGTASVS